MVNTSNHKLRIDNKRRHILTKFSIALYKADDKTVEEIFDKNIGTLAEVCERVIKGNER